MYEGIDVLDYVWVVEWFHEVDFLEALLALLLICHIKNLSSRDRYLDLLEGKRLALLIFGSVYNGELALPDGFRYGVALNLLSCQLIIFLHLNQFKY